MEQVKYAEIKARQQLEQQQSGASQSSGPAFNPLHHGTVSYTQTPQINIAVTAWEQECLHI